MGGPRRTRFLAPGWWLLHLFGIALVYGAGVLSQGWW